MRFTSRLIRIDFLVAVISLSWGLFSDTTCCADDSADVVATFLSANCIDCHNGSDVEAGLDLSLIHI